MILVQVLESSVGGTDPEEPSPSPWKSVLLAPAKSSLGCVKKGSGHCKEWFNFEKTHREIFTLRSID